MQGLIEFPGRCFDRFHSDDTDDRSMERPEGFFSEMTAFNPKYFVDCSSPQFRWKFYHAVVFIFISTVLGVPRNMF
ncbi:MAG: hypothetical protein BWY82_02848 [Verrucomicrobia bacterium ADurb.Bin474]|nr:MAG: hypothetical protein BWY82_02848 [Verrucomicrobia bacterium ADurb.Bin474]